jgi:hypothetical protein
MCLRRELRVGGVVAVRYLAGWEEASIVDVSEDGRRVEVLPVELDDVIFFELSSLTAEWKGPSGERLTTVPSE